MITPQHLHTDAHAIHCTFMSSVKHPPVIFHEIRKVSEKMQQFASVLRKKIWPPAFCFIPVFWHFMYTLSWKLDPFLDTFQRAATKWPVCIIFKCRTYCKGATTCSRIACGHINGNNRHWFWMRRGQLPLLDIGLHGAGKYLSRSAAAPPWYRVYRVLVRAVNGLARNLTVPGPKTRPPHI